MNDEGLVANDWLAAVGVLVDGDDVEMLQKLICTHHIHARDEIGWTLLHWACQCGCLKCAEWLLKCGAGNDVRYTEDSTPLLLAASGGHANCVALLLSHGVRVDSITQDCGTPLAYALRYDNKPHAARLLLDAGASVELAQKNTTPPSWADDFLRGRRACASAVIAFVGSSDRRYRDVARLIGKLIWNTRGAADWEYASMWTKRSK